MRHKKYPVISVSQKDNPKLYWHLYYKYAVKPFRKSTATGKAQTRTRCPLCSMLVYPANFDSPISTDIKYFAGYKTFKLPIPDNPTCQYHRLQYEEAVKKKLILLCKHFGLTASEEFDFAMESSLPKQEESKQEFNIGMEAGMYG